MQLSKHFTLEDLTTTSHRDVDNQPDVFALENLRKTALLLDLIYDQVGPFRVTSAYRSPALNQKLAGDKPVSTTSYHLRGFAADLYPENDSAYDFFVKILRSPIFGIVGELINEADEQGIVHVSIPTDSKTSVAMYLRDGAYYRYSQSEIEAMKQGYEIEGSSEVIEYTDYNESNSLSPIAMIAIAGAAFAVVTVMLAAKARRAQ